MNVQMKDTRVKQAMQPSLPGLKFWICRLAAASLLLGSSAVAEDAVKRSTWNGLERLDFQVGGRNALLIVPPKADVGRPWIWRTEFFGHEPQADLALTEKGFHIAYVHVQNLYGAPNVLPTSM